MSEEIVYSNLTSKSSCPVGYYTVNISGSDRCCLTPDCSGYGFGVNPRSGGSECCEMLPPNIEVQNSSTNFSFSCTSMNWEPTYCDYVTIAYPTIEECSQKLSEAQTWISTNAWCGDHDVSGCVSLTGGYLLNGLNPPEMPTQEEIDTIYCPPPSGP